MQFCQATEIETLLAVGGLLARQEGHLTLGGDPQQLGPIVLSKVGKDNGLGVSMIERITMCQGYLPKDGVYPRDKIVKLVRNFRTNQQLLKVPSELFYDGELKSCADPSKVNGMQEFTGLNKNIPLVIDATLGEATQVGSPSYSNLEEAMKVRDWVLKLRASGEDDRDIGVITPYNSQVKLNKNMIGSDDVLVATVKTFQGREKKTIIIATV